MPVGSSGGRELRSRLLELARREGVSLNQAALRLMRRGAGLGRRGAVEHVGHALDHLIGTWTEDQAREVLEAAEDFEVVDEDLWR